MKRFFYLSLAAVAMLAVGCEQELERPESASPFDKDGNGYMKIALNLPTTPMTKDGNHFTDTTSNDNFDDGLAQEYKVENAILVLFSKPENAASEDDYKLRSAYNLGAGEWQNSNATQITTTREIIQKIQENGANNEPLYAFIILNHHEFFDVIEENDITTLAYMPLASSTSLTNYTFAEFRKLTLDETGKDYSKHSFYMSNMPYINLTSNQIGTGNLTVNTLVPVDANAIKSTYQAAQNTAATVINVERALAKITVDWISPSGGNSLETTGSGKHYPYEFLGWFVDNTNPTTYAVRNMKDPVNNDPYAYIGYKSSRGNYRFASATRVDANQTPVRTYWGFDMNYNDSATNLITKAGKVSNGNVITVVENGTFSFEQGHFRGKATSYYCTENTFDVAHQSNTNSTRVVVAAKFNGGQDFYTSSNSTASEITLIPHKDSLSLLIIKSILDRVSATQWINTYKPGYNPSDAQLLADFSVTYTDVDGTNGTEATASVAPTQNFGSTGMSAWNENQANHDSYLKMNFRFKKYTNGVAYYSALIRHFNDYDTPWVAQAGMANTTAGVYGTGTEAEQNYLGRYGVLRNNWYNIYVDGISQIGSPTVPPVTPEVPDDQVENWLNITINIMPWAVRTQHVTL